MSSLRPAAVAGAFYPDNAQELRRVIETHLAGATTSGPTPKAIIAPHAGYIYSGPIAAQAYARLRPAAQAIRKVVLVGPSHRVAFRGIAVSRSDFFQTPLGRVPTDPEALALAAALPGVQVLDAAHAREHSLEVHLPFLQHVLGDFGLVPLVAGHASPEDVARVLEALWGGPETVIVISSDLSHYLPYPEARLADERTAAAIETLSGDALDQDSACGRVPIAGLLALARRRNLRVERLDVRNSGDTAGPRDAVVGYGAWAFHEETAGDTSDPDAARNKVFAPHGKTLLKLARKSIRHGLQFGCPLPVVAERHPSPLSDKGAAFVTLRSGGQLRGCIGTPAAWRPLVTDVAENAYHAAFRDPRFPPVGEDEIERLDVSISVLTPPEAMTVRDRNELVRNLRPGRDGLIVEDWNHRALFLPSVWEQLPDPEAFLGHLLAKAGLSPHHWSPTLTARRFANIEIKDA